MGLRAFPAQAAMWIVLGAIEPFGVARCACRMRGAGVGVEQEDLFGVRTNYTWEAPSSDTNKQQSTSPSVR